MLTLFHSPRSRSTRILDLLHAMKALDRVEIRNVSIPRVDGSGGRDLANPHPEGKVPLLDHDGVHIWESAAIMLYLTDLFPEAGLGVPPGHPQRGRYLSWLFYYGSVVEPVLIHAHAGLDHPVLHVTFRGIPELTARLSTALGKAPWLMGENYTAADLLMASPYHWFTDAVPDDPAIRDWVRRCGNRDSTAAALDHDERLAAELSL
ncbi:MAG: glutathione S-transferase family protein [Rubellimicrobium sp.]|nr:glutathione S-transferase family protein [Rubellimicrobium sp.]